MDSNAHIEIILQELTLLDPNLKEREADLRSILVHLSAKKPLVVPDATFASTLRERVLTIKPLPLRSPYTSVNWWAVHLAPVGALALLLLILAPQSLHSPMDTESTPPSSQSENTMLRMESVDTSSGGSDVELYDVSSEDAPESTMMKSGAPMENLPLPLTVSSQTPGVSVRIDSVTTWIPSFIGISAYLPDGTERLVGVSPLIVPGTTMDIPVYLRTPTHVGESYTATLYADNGNRVFTYGEDTPVTDAYGNPASVTFVITGTE